MHYTGRLVDSNAPEFSMTDFALKFLNGLRWKKLDLFVPNSNVFNIWAHIHAYLCHKHYFSFISVLYCFERHNIRYIGERSVYRSRFDGGCQQSNQLPALVSRSLEMYPKNHGRRHRGWGWGCIPPGLKFWGVYPPRNHDVWRFFPIFLPKFSDFKIFSK